MKKSIIIVIAIGMLGFAGWNKSDDDKIILNECQVCNLDLLGQSVASEFYDNGDGTITITTQGDVQTEPLDGVSFKQFIAAYEQLGANCNKK